MESLHQYLAAVMSCIFALLLFLYYFPWKIRRSSSDNNMRSAPEAAGAWPIIGHLPMLGGHQLPHITLGNLADRYGPAFTIRLGVCRALVVSSSEVAKECFTTNDKAFATRPSSVAVKLMGYNYALFGLAPYTSYWREVRKIVILELLSNRRLELLKHVRISEVNTSIKELFQVWASSNNKNEKGQVLVEMQRWFGDLTINVAVRMVAGKRYFGASVNTCDDEEEARRFQKAIKNFFHLVGLYVLSDSLPFLEWLDFEGHQKAMKRTFKDMDCILQRWLEEHRRDKENGAMKEERDFMDVMLSILKDANLFGYEADTVNKATSLNIILGATDTTMVTLTWALSLLLNNRHILKKAEDEIDIHVGKDKAVDESDIEKLVYLQAIVKETLRLYPVAPLLAAHEAIEDCIVAGYHVPRGTRLIPNIWKIQRDPRIWSSPCEFQPERFLTGTQANVDVRGQHFELLPFGSGRRSCPGTSFALQVVHLALARVLQGFEFDTPSNKAIDMTESAGLTNLKATPLQVLITPCLPLNLY